jgi:hypothetical protein
MPQECAESIKSKVLFSVCHAPDPLGYLAVTLGIAIAILSILAIAAAIKAKYPRLSGCAIWDIKESCG